VKKIRAVCSACNAVNEAVPDVLLATTGCVECGKRGVLEVAPPPPPKPKPKPKTTPGPVKKPQTEFAYRCEFCDERYVYTHEVDAENMLCEACDEVGGFRPVVRSGRPAAASPSAGGMRCQACGGELKKGKNATGGAMGCIFLIVGVGLCLTGIGALLGIPIILLGLHYGMKREGVWRCSRCNAEIPRKMGLLEWG